MEQNTTVTEMATLLVASALGQITTRELATAGNYLLMFDPECSVADYENALSIDPEFVERPGVQR